MNCLTTIIMKTLDNIVDTLNFNVDPLKNMLLHLIIGVINAYFGDGTSRAICYF
jgi:hypothetical protein